MKTWKYLLMAMTVMTSAVGFTACDDDDNNDNNYTRYQKSVDETVKATQKASGNDKAILLVAFGSTWQQAFETFDGIVANYKSDPAFAGYDVYLSFSSAICINRSAAGENTTPRNFYDPEHWLTACSKVGYKDIVVQSLQVIPGEEYRKVRDTYIKDFMNNKNGDVDDNYLASVNIYLGTPLMAEEADVENLAKVLDNLHKSDADKGVVAFMGHGNPEGYDYYGANIRYTQLEEKLQELNSNFFVGTVDMEGNYVDDVYNRMQEAGKTTGNVLLMPLMSIAGDHAHNDMSDPEDDESWFSLFNSWGYNTTTNIKGLGEFPEVVSLWKNHTKAAMASEPLDYYHSKNPE